MKDVQTVVNHQMLLAFSNSSPTSSQCLHSSPTSSPLILPDIKTCKTMRDIQQFHAQKIKTGRIRDTFTAAQILKFYAVSNHRGLLHARLLFDQMEEPNCFSWNTIIRAFSESDQPVESILVYHQLLHDEFVQPNQYTFPSVLKACAQIFGFEEGKQIHGQIVKCGLSSDDFILSNLIRMYVICGVMDDANKLFRRRVGSDRRETNVVLWNVMMDGYLRIGELQSARELFDQMSQRSVVSWNTMIGGYAQNGCFKETLEMFYDMQLTDLSPTYVTLVSILPSISRIGALDLGEWVHIYAVKNEIKVDEVLGSALIDMYSKCGSIDKALQVFEGLTYRNVVTWNSIIGGLAMHGRGNSALDYFVRMEQAGVAPTDVTFIGVLTACSHAGLVDEGRKHFSNMVGVYGLRPRIEHYGCMVDLFGRAGLLKEAEELVLNMPMKPDDVIWKAMLGACRIHGNIEIGERVAERLMGLAPDDSGSYVLLSNMYASVGSWEAVAKVRLMMKGMDIRKDPGCSLIAIDGRIHEFHVQDDSHPRAKEINSMLEEMTDRLRSVGYTPLTTQVLLNINEREKENILCYHSEKIAIAYGLISTSPSTTLQIAKNLRICVDCHSSIKLISKVYNRRIIVRDRHRFHHFEKGSCSCMDFW